MPPSFLPFRLPFIDTMDHDHSGMDHGHGGHGGHGGGGMGSDQCSMNVRMPSLSCLLGFLLTLKNRCSSLGTPPTSASSSASGTSAPPPPSSSPSSPSSSSPWATRVCARCLRSTSRLSPSASMLCLVSYVSLIYLLSALSFISRLQSLMKRADRVLPCLFLANLEQQKTNMNL